MPGGGQFMNGQKLPISQFQVAPYNPRKISDDELERLKSSIWSHTEALEGWQRADGFRLVDPIVVNKTNSRIVSGHQRVKALQALGQNWVHDGDVRFVMVDDERKEAALNVVLNNPGAQGKWDFPKLKDLVVEIDAGDFDIERFTGFDGKELQELFGRAGGRRPEVEFSEEMLLEHNYIVLYFDNPLDWEVAKEKFGLQKVKDLIEREAQPTGIGRVLKGAEWLARIK